MSDRIVVIDHGRVEQVGAPREIYDRPATAFVAEFVGESNVWNGIIERQPYGGHALVTTAGQRFPLPDRAYRPGQPARMIVRPEAIRLDAGPEAARLLGVLLDVVYAGSMTKYIVSTSNGQVIKVVSHGPTRERGERVGVTWNPAAAHLFQEE